MNEPHQTPGRPIEEWTDQELIVEYRHLLAATADFPDGDFDEASALERAREEMTRRGLEEHLDGVDPDATGPDGEPFDPSVQD